VGEEAEIGDRTLTEWDNDKKKQTWSLGCVERVEWGKKRRRLGNLCHGEKKMSGGVNRRGGQKTENEGCGDKREKTRIKKASGVSKMGSISRSRKKRKCCGYWLGGRCP